VVVTVSPSSTTRRMRAPLPSVTIAVVVTQSVTSTSRFSASKVYVHVTPSWVRVVMLPLAS